MRSSQNPGRIFVAEIRKGFKEVVFQAAITDEDKFEEAVQLFHSQKHH